MNKMNCLLFVRRNLDQLKRLSSIFRNPKKKIFNLHCSRLRRSNWIESNEFRCIWWIQRMQINIESHLIDDFRQTERLTMKRLCNKKLVSSKIHLIFLLFSDFNAYMDALINCLYSYMLIWYLASTLLFLPFGL